MSDRMTSINLPGCGEPGIAEYGRESPEHMIALYRARATRQKECAEKVLVALDSDFRVDTYTGVIVQRNREIIQEGKKP